MKFNSFSLVSLSLLSVFAMSAQANEVHLITKKPTKIEYRLAYEDQGQEPIFGATQMVQVNGNYNIPLALASHQAVGVVIESVNGHVLPDTAKQFNKEEQCSIATNSLNTGGKLYFNADKHSITCSRSYI